MTVEEATRTVAILTAAFPDATIEPTTFRLWVESLVPLQHAAQAEQAARLIANTGRKFPLIVEFKETYRAKVDQMPKVPELEPVTSGKRQIPDEVREWMRGRGLRTP